MRKITIILVFFVLSSYVSAIMIMGEQEHKIRNTNMSSKNITDVDCIGFSDGVLCTSVTGGGEGGGESFFINISDNTIASNQSFYEVLLNNTDLVFIRDSYGGINFKNITLDTIFKISPFNEGIGWESYYLYADVGENHVITLNDSYLKVLDLEIYNDSNSNTHIYLPTGKTLQIKSDSNIQLINLGGDNFLYTDDDVRIMVDVDGIYKEVLQFTYANSLMGGIIYFRNDEGVVSYMSMCNATYTTAGREGSWFWNQVHGDIIWNSASQGSFRSDDNKYTDLGESSKSWDDCYCDDFVNTPRDILTLNEYNRGEINIKVRDIDESILRTQTYNKKDLLGSVTEDMKTEYLNYVDLLKDLPYNSQTGLTKHDNIPLPLRGKNMEKDTVSTYAYLTALREALLEQQVQLEVLKQQCGIGLLS